MIGILGNKKVKSRAFFFFSHFGDLLYGMFIDVVACPRTYSKIRRNAFDRLEKAYRAYQGGKSNVEIKKIFRGQLAK